MLRITLLAAASALALAACGQSTQTAETSAPPAIDAPAQTATVDAQFAQLVANSDAFEIQASQLAAERATRNEVKQFAQTMVTDHTATSQELATLAPTLGLTAPQPVLEADAQAKLDRLRGLNGAEFDDAYLDEQVAAHEAAVQAFQNYVQTAQAGPLRDWASTTLPKLQTHLASVQTLENAT